MSFMYPSSDLDRPSTLLSLLGSFWTSIYGDRDTVSVLLRGRAISEQQVQQNLAEFLACRGRQSTPVWHQERWISLTLKMSEKTTNGDRSEWPAPANLADASAIMNRLSSPSLTLTRNVDFEVSGDKISFRDDPFDDTRVPTQTVDDDDEEAYLWIFQGLVDVDFLYRYWGYVIGVQMASSDAYKSFINAYLDGVTGGTALEQIGDLYSALTDIPLAKHNGEVVEQIGEDLDGKVVVTSEEIYRLPSNATLVVEADDELAAGDPLCDSLRIVELTNGEVPSYLTQLSLDRTMIPLPISGSLIFLNEEVPLETAASFSSSLSSSSIGQETESVAVRFYIGGDAADVEIFWAAVRAAEARDGTSLAALLKVHPDGPTSAANLPDTINPLEFIIENLLRFNTILAVVRSAILGAGALGLDKAPLSRPVLPLGKSVLLVEIE